jgi:hypothetical protein
MTEFAWSLNVHYRGSADECWRYFDDATGRWFEVRIDHAPRCDPDDPDRRFPPRYFLDELTPNGRLMSENGEIWDVPHNEWSLVRSTPSRAIALLERCEGENPGFKIVLSACGYSLDSVYLASWEEVEAAVRSALDEDRWYVANGGSFSQSCP